MPKKIKQIPRIVIVKIDGVECPALVTRVHDDGSMTAFAFSADAFRVSNIAIAKGEWREDTGPGTEETDEPEASGL